MTQNMPQTLAAWWPLLLTIALAVGGPSAMLALIFKGWMAKFGEPMLKTTLVTWYNSPEQVTERALFIKTTLEEHAKHETQLNDFTARVKTILVDQIRRDDGVLCIEINNKTKEAVNELNESVRELRTQVTDLKTQLTEVNKSLSEIRGGLDVLLSSRPGNNRLSGRT